MLETTPTVGTSLWERWLNKRRGQFVVVEYYDGRTLSGTVDDFDNAHVALVSVQRKNHADVPILANLSEVRYIRVKE